MATPELTILVQAHLPCAANEQGRASGRTTEGVSPGGRLLAGRVRLDEPRHGPIAVILCSTLPRAVETVELCFGSCGIPVVRDPRLCAIDYGRFHDKTLQEIRRLRDRYVDEPFPQGESFEQMAGRYRSCLDEALDRFPGEQVLLIGHNSTAAMLEHLCRGIPLRQALADQDAGPARPAARIEALYSGFLGPWVYVKRLA